MVLDDLLQHILGAGMIPDPIGPHDGDGAIAADLQAICLGSLDPASHASVIAMTLWPGQFQFIEASFEKLPRPLALIA